MRIEASKCDNCGKETSDIGKIQGWMRITSSRIFIVGNDGKVERESLKIRGIPTSEDTLDFCCIKCFLHWLYIGMNTEARTPDYQSQFYQMINDEVGIKKEN